MNKQKSVSIRVKILLLLTLLPLLVLAAYLSLAVEVFQSDKIAYVFEETTNTSKSLGDRAQSEWSSSLAAARPIMSDWTETQAFGEFSKKIISTGQNLSWVAVFGPDEKNEYVKLGQVDALEGVAEKEILQAGINNSWVQRLVAAKRGVVVPFKDERIIIFETVQTPEGENLFFVIMTRATELLQVFRTPGSIENYLIDSRGVILMGPLGTDGTDLGQRYPLGFLQINDANRVNGSEEVTDSYKEHYLLAYAKIPFAGLSVVSVVPKKAALAAVQILMRKSILFFALLILVTLIVSLVASKNLTATLTQLFQATQSVSKGNFDIRVPVTSKDEVGSLALSFNKMAAEVSRLLSETAEKARMQAELQTAQTVQETLFPPVSAEIGNLAVTGFYEPASECGGDWWHYNLVDNKVFLWIGDATGHGAPAALITSAAKSASTVIESLKVDPAAALSLLNRSIYDVSRGRIMMTFFLACYDSTTGELTYANASHESPFLIRKTDQVIKKKDLIPLNEVNNPRLGQSRDTVYQQTTIKLELGDRVLFYTDGIPDIQNLKFEPWGEREFLKAVLKCNQNFPPVNQSVAALTESFQTYRTSAPLIDDITFFMAEVRNK